jgi:site-specific DNA-methyltransferase (adenine-specific)
MKVNKIYNEDCFKTMSKMLENSVDVLFTSPPYNRKRNDKYSHYNDNIENYYDFLKKSILEYKRITKRYIFLNIQKNYYNKKEVFKLIGDFYNDIFEIFIWQKSNPLPASGFAITNSYEFIICFSKELKSNKTYTKNHIRTSVNKMHKEHKAVMKLEVADFFIKNFTKENDLVYDPFMGLGTTAISCIKNNVNFIGSEMVKRYCDIAEKRISNEN